MQYRATVRNLVHHNPFEVLLANLERSSKTQGFRQKSKISVSMSNISRDWYQINEAAIAPSDFWFNMVEEPKQKRLPPPDRQTHLRRFLF